MAFGKIRRWIRRVIAWFHGPGGRDRSGLYLPGGQPTMLVADKFVRKPASLVSEMGSFNLSLKSLMVSRRFSQGGDVSLDGTSQSGGGVLKASLFETDINGGGQDGFLDFFYGVAGIKVQDSGTPTVYGDLYTTPISTDSDSPTEAYVGIG